MRCCIPSTRFFFFFPSRTANSDEQCKINGKINGVLKSSVAILLTISHGVGNKCRYLLFQWLIRHLQKHNIL